jgi:hypothetical protein
VVSLLLSLSLSLLLLLLLSLLLLLFVFAVILSEAKDPEAAHPPIPLEPFNQQISLLSLLVLCHPVGILPLSVRSTSRQPESARPKIKLKTVA